MQAAVRRFGFVVSAAAAAIGFSAAAFAQMAYPPGPPPGPEIAEIGACICLREASEQLGAQMSAANQAYQQGQDQLNQATSALETARAQVDVNNPQAVARFRQMVEQRQTLFGQVTGPLVTAAGAATQRYNARVNEYNARCTNRPMDPVLAARIRPTLNCPPP